MFKLPLIKKNNTFYDELDIKPDSTNDELSKAINTKVNQLNKEKSTLEREIKEKGNQTGFDIKIEEVDKKINEINALNLKKPENREKYDLETPPCSVIKLEKVSIPFFEEKNTQIHFLRKELTDFFKKEKNLDSYHPSDTTKSNFQIDFIFNKYLDNE